MLDADDEPAPGCPGGKCLAPDGSCHEGTCNKDAGANYCYDPADPCRGFFCGGADRGACVVEDALPSCVCAAGYNNDMYALYCCPDDGSDPNCG